MTVSFIVIAYNEEKRIAATLNSIFGLEGLPKDFEVVVVNDGSLDNTLQIVKQARVSLPQIKLVDLQPNQGRGAARAAGVDAAGGDYIAFVDADIILPKQWLSICMNHMPEYDACGGTAVPDGDVAWIHRKLNLIPKVATHSTTVSGGNGLFKRAVFDSITFNANKKDGEDVDLGYKLLENGFKTHNIDGLIVAHIEAKSFNQSLRWLFQSGKGASQQLYEHKQVRLPDLAFFGFLSIIVAVALAWSFVNPKWRAAMATLPLSYLLASSALHMNTKFLLTKTLFRSIAGIAANSALLSAYYLGRLVGMSTKWKSL